MFSSEALKLSMPGFVMQDIVKFRQRLAK